MKRLNNRGWCCTELVGIIFQGPRKLRNRINWNERVASKKRSWRTIALFIARSTLQNTLMIALNGFASTNVRRTHVHRSIFFSPPSVLFDFCSYCGSGREFLVQIFFSLRYLATRHQVRRLLLIPAEDTSRCAWNSYTTTASRTCWKLWGYRGGGRGVQEG